MIGKFSILVVCTAVLAACSPGMNISQQPVRVTPKFPEKSFGLDVYAAARQQGDPAPEYRGERLVTVRTIFARTGQGSTEFAGARCKIDSPAYSAEVTTPVQIVVPDYGSNSPVISANCRANDRNASSSVAVFNSSQRRRDQAYDPFFYGGFGWPYHSGTRVGVGVSVNLSDRSNDIYEYPTLRVKFE